MPAAPAQPAAPVALIYGDEDFAVKQRARQLNDKWRAEVGGMDHETIDAAVGNSGEALKALGKLREGLQTLPFFGGGKVVWFKDCSFLGDDRMSASSAVTEALAELAAELKTFRWDGVRLLVSAGKVDKRKTFFKTLEKLGSEKAMVLPKGFQARSELAPGRSATNCLPGRFRCPTQTWQRPVWRWM